MQRSLEQRYAIKFCVKLGKTGTETLEMLRQAYAKEALSSAQVFRWHKAFKDGREDVEDEQRSGCPSSSTSDQNVRKKRVKEVLYSDRRVSVRMIADIVGLPKTDVHRIVSGNLHMRKICAKLVPKVLTADQKNIRVSISRELTDRLTSEPNFLQRVITGDKTWVFEYDPETKRQSSEWHTPASPRQKKARMSKSKIKSMLIVFFDCRGVVHKEFVPTRQTVNAKFYVQVLDRLRKRVARVRPEIKHAWILHHDNASSHTALTVREFLATKNIPTLPQPPYSPDMAPCDFFLFLIIIKFYHSHLCVDFRGFLEKIYQAITS